MKLKMLRNEKGFTLIELLVTIAIAVFVVGAASMTIITMMRLSPQSNDWVIALRQVQNAGYWISQDITMANEGTITINAQFLPALQVDDWNGSSFSTHTVEYVFNGQTLMRNCDTSPIFIAENIDTVATKFEDITPPGKQKEYRLTVKATVNGTSVTRTYEISQRLQ